MPNGQNMAPIDPAMLQRFIEGTSPDERARLLDRVPTSSLMPFKSGDHAALLGRAAQASPDVIQKAMEGWAKKPVNAEFLKTAGGPGGGGDMMASGPSGLMELLQGILAQLPPETLQGLLALLMGGDQGMPPMGPEEMPPMGPEGAMPPMGPEMLGGMPPAPMGGMGAPPMPMPM